MKDILDHVKLVSMNAGSWIATVGSMAVAQDIIQILCLLASLTFSCYSIWWIKRQAEALDAKDKKVE
jgi:putative effector of murein hydrolase LrgA (UPF0299 family)